jgi:hypothetical protein
MVWYGMVVIPYPSLLGGVCRYQQLKTEGVWYGMVPVVASLLCVWYGGVVVVLWWYVL